MFVLAVAAVTVSAVIRNVSVNVSEVSGTVASGKAPWLSLTVAQQPALPMSSCPNYISVCSGEKSPNQARWNQMEQLSSLESGVLPRMTSHPTCRYCQVEAGGSGSGGNCHHRHQLSNCCFPESFSVLPELLISVTPAVCTSLGSATEESGRTEGRFCRTGCLESMVF